METAKEEDDLSILGTVPGAAKPKEPEKELTMADILKLLKQQKTHFDFLMTIKNTPGLTMLQDNGWFWLEFNGVEVPNSAKERFTKASEMDDLLLIAGL